MVIARKSSQLGLTIVELMVGLVLGLFLLGGVLHIYMGSSQTYRTTEALSRVQEGGRFALDFLSDDLRRAGSQGDCMKSVEVKNHLDTANAAYDDVLFDLTDGLRGWESQNGGFAGNNYRAGTDVVLIKHAGTAAILTVNGTSQTQANAITVVGNTGIGMGQIILISDPEGCDLFQNAANANASALNRANPGNPHVPGNSLPSEPLSHAYTNDVRITEVRSSVYYVGAGASGVPSLFRRRVDTGTPQNEELVEGIIDMQLCYGVDANMDGTAENYVQANAVGSWMDVVAVRVTLVAMSPETRVATEVPTVQYAGCDGAVINRGVADYPEFAQRPLTRVFTTTVALRNKLL